jgi:hypothetical protein
VAGPSRRSAREAALNRDILATYLNDHLAGSVAALELVDRLHRLSSGTDREQVFLTLGQEIAEDQQIVKVLLRSVGGKESKVRKAAAWLTEKIGEAKLELDDSGNGQFRLLEALETLGLGIQGKLGLWRALGAAASQDPEIEKLDLPRLERRALDQFARVEAQRLQVARAAFGA